MDAEEVSEQTHDNVDSLNIMQTTIDSAQAGVETAAFCANAPMPSSAPLALPREKVEATLPEVTTDKLNKECEESTPEGKGHKFFEEDSNGEEAEEDASGCAGSQLSENSSEFGADQMHFKYNFAKNLSNDIVHSVRGDETVSGKRKREDPAIGFVPTLPMEISQTGKTGGFHILRAATPASSPVGSIEGIQSTALGEGPEVIVIDDDEDDGGIFDDAEEDTSFDVPTYAPSTAPPERKALSPFAFPSPTKKMRKKLEKPGSGVGEKGKRKRAPQPLNGKKESEAAGVLLAGLDDLLQVLPSEDCHFLAKNLWIFTVQQLEVALDPSLIKTVSEPVAERNVREELLQAVATSALVEDNARSYSDGLTQNEENEGFLGLETTESKPDVTSPDVTETNSDPDESDPLLISLRTNSHTLKSRLTTNSNVRAAEARLITWDALLSTWRGKKGEQTAFARTTSVEDKFPLNGPVSYLIPQELQSFLATLKIFSLSQFLSLRKTESGMATLTFRKWRSLCNLPVVHDVLLSKHLLGITTRLEVAVTSVPWADFYTRTWMGCELVVLTGAAREFIIDECKITDPEDFVTQKTKGLADLLEKWREIKKMPQLKGTGKVAMISGWKTSVKEELSIARAEGTTFNDVDLLELAENDSREDIAPKITKKKEKNESSSKKQPAGENIPRAEAALRSPQFLKKVLGLDKASILIAAGVDTAEKLFNADKHTSSPLVQKMVEARKSSAFPGSTQAASNMRLLYDWTTKLRGKLEELKDAGDKNNKSKAIIKSPSRHYSTNVESSEKARINPNHRKDPIDALSVTARNFLASLDILSGKDLLTTRTTDIASAFVPWREANDLPVLKGLGAIASVSGWKATVRKASAEMGLPEASDVKLRHLPRRVEMQTPPPKTELRPPITHIEPMTHPELLFGNASRRIAVRSSKGPTVIYFFLLSVRSSHNDELNETVFLSYLGSKQVQADGKILDQVEGSGVNFRKEQRNVSLNPILPILPEEHLEITGNDCADQAISSGFSPFSAHCPGCGIIELTKYGVFHLSQKKAVYEQLFSVKREITQFLDVGGQIHLGSMSRADDRRGTAAWRTSKEKRGNAFIKTSTNGRVRCFAYLKDPIERGQVVELMFTSQFSGLSDNSKIPAVIKQRLHAADAINNLAFDHVAPVFDYLVTEILHNITNEILEAVHPRVNYAKLSLALRKRRRLHWVATLLLRHGARSSPHSDTLSDVRYLPVQKLLWDHAILSKLDTLSDTSKTELLKILKDDIESEIVLDLAASGTLNLFSDDSSLVSSVADECLRGSLDVVAFHLTKQDSQYTSSKLQSELSSVVCNSVALIKREGEAPSNDLELARRPLRVNFAQAGSGLREEQDYDERKHHAASIPMTEKSDTKSPQSLTSGYAAEQTPSFERRCEAPIDLLDYPNMDLVTMEDLINGRASLNRRWYIENQVLFIVQAVVTAAASQWQQMEECFSFSELRKTAYRTASDSSRQPLQGDDEEPSVDCLAVRMFIKSGKLSASNEPHPLPIFLGTVWPKLSKLGWRLEVGNSPDKFAFVPPGQATSNRKVKDARVKQIKQERARRRAKLAKEASETGLGHIPKLLKHLFASAIQVDEREDEDDFSECSVGLVLENFDVKMENDLDFNERESMARLRLIMKHIKECFNEIAPRLMLTDETLPTKDDKLPSSAGIGNDPVDIYGCRFFLRFLLVLPGILYEANIPPEQLQDSLSVVQELLNFMTTHHREFVEPSFYPPKEELLTDEPIEPVLVPKLVKLSADDGKKEKVAVNANQVFLAEGADVVVLPSDRPCLTNFVNLVMSQLVVCRATVDDAGKKNRRIQAGHPGLLCRHCRGDGGEGRYFFSTLESLTTASTVIEKHISRCPKTPEDIKSKMVQYRAKHGEQRLNLESGSQGAYFGRLFDRLMSSRSCPDPNIYMKPLVDSLKEGSTSPVSSLSGLGREDTGEEMLEFRSHVHLLEYIKQTGEWYNRKEVLESMEEYYKCLEYGGSIFGTSAMPLHFSAEWVLAKVGPRNKNRFHESD